MNSKTTQSRLLYGSGIAFMLALCCFLPARFTADQRSTFDALHQTLQRYLLADKAEIRHYFRLLQQGNTASKESLEAVQTHLHQSPYFIEVWQNDSLVFWNDRTISEDAMHNRVIAQETEGQFTSKISWAGLAGNPHLSRFSHVSVAAPTDSLSHKIMLEQWPLHIVAGPSPWVEFFRTATWLSLFAGFFLFSIWLFFQWVEKPGLPTVFKTLLAIAGIKTAFYLPVVTQWWSGFFMVDATFTDAIFTPSLTHFMIHLWVGGCFLFYLARRPELLRCAMAKVGVRNIAVFTGFFTLIIFGNALHLIRSFVMFPGIQLESETLMQFKIVSFVFVVLMSIFMILLFQSTHLLQELLTRANETFSRRLVWQSFGWLGATLILYLSGMPFQSIWMLLMFVAAYSLMLDAYCENKEKKVTYLIWWLMLFSGFEATGIFYYSLQKDIASRKEFPHRLAVATDPEIIREMKDWQDRMSEREVFTTISNLDPATRLDREDLFEFVFGRPSENGQVAATYLELFDQRTGTTLFHHHFADYYKIKQSVDQAIPVSENLYHNPFEDTYYLRFEILKEGRKDGDLTSSGSDSWFLYVIREGKFINEIKKNKLQPHSFGYACFNRGQLIFREENNEMSPDAALLASIDSTSVRQGFSFVVTKLNPQYQVISWKKVSGLIKPISIFSYLFTLSGLLLILLAFINTRVPFLPSGISMRFGEKSSLKTRIQLAVIALVLTTFLIIGAITAFYFHNLMQAGKKSENAHETTTIINHIRADIQQFADEESALLYLRRRLKELSAIHQKELTLYDHAGKITGTTQREEVQWFVPYTMVHGINSLASFVNSGGTETQTTDFIGLSIGNTRPFAFLAIHHLASGSTSDSILNFLSTILNAYIFLFLIAGAIAITMSNSITQPLTILAEKLKKFKLGKTNERLEWHSQDEIGTLIADYNNLTHELERSAGLLAKTERDLAWREMAKQVAHEIKNPLTPMKLSIQYLDRAAKEQPEKAQEMIPKISSTLIEQIDNLSQIASEFSNFATMPQATNEKVILNEIVETIHDLFRKRDDMDIHMIEPIDDLTVFADKNHLVRILNNLLKNAIQAIPEKRRGKIDIELKRENGDALIRISDNGSGIPDHMKEKVFTPNFTTKNSGTGLGLAISANMIESFNGKIYFETKVGKGTDFYVRIPLMRLDEIKEEGNRVEL
jgi:signal transduction histidine kinase